MAACLQITALLLLALARISASNDVTSVLMERMDAMEERHHAEIRGLEEKMSQQTKIIGDLEGALRQKDTEYTSKISKLEEMLSTGNVNAGKEWSEMSAKEEVRPKSRRGILDGFNVAFSAYMDHVVNGLGPGQTLIYNKILLNDGNAYNNHSGMFTAPIPGVYSFSFFVGERDNNDEWVALWVNSENKIDAAVQTMHTTQDLQGGNTVNLKLQQGDVVYVKNIADGHVEGSDTLRLTSFSGFLIYPVESSVVVGK